MKREKLLDILAKIASSEKATANHRLEAARLIAEIEGWLAPIQTINYVSDLVETNAEIFEQEDDPPEEEFN